MSDRTITIQGPLVRQPVIAARLAGAFISAAETLWEAATLDDAAQMWEEGRAAASWALAACDRVEADLPRQRPKASELGTVAACGSTASPQGLLPGLQPQDSPADPG